MWFCDSGGIQIIIEAHFSTSYQQNIFRYIGCNHVLKHISFAYHTLIKIACDHVTKCFFLFFFFEGGNR